jgi:mRNA interferase RelE/StbE
LAWRVEVSRTAQNQINKLDRRAQVGIIRYLRERVLTLDDPRQLGKALHGEKKGLWRYRAGDYRIICNLEGQANSIVVLAVGHRKDVYR